MDVHAKRSREIVSTMNKVMDALQDRVDVPALEQAKIHLKTLCAQRELFPESDFPWPTSAEDGRSYCVYMGAERTFALYVDLLPHGVGTVPHDHGDSWAIVTSIQGCEKHNFYKRVDGGDGPGPATLEHAGSVTISDGESVSMLAEGIHALEAVDPEPVMILHCYGKAFDKQAARLEYDVDAGTCAYGTDAVGEIEDMPLHQDAAR